MAKQDNMNSGKRAGGVGHIFAVIGKIVGTILLTAFLTARCVVMSAKALPSIPAACG